MAVVGEQRATGVREGGSEGGRERRKVTTWGQPSYPRLDPLTKALGSGCPVPPPGKVTQ